MSSHTHRTPFKLHKRIIISFTWLIHFLLWSIILSIVLLLINAVDTEINSLVHTVDTTRAVVLMIVSAIYLLSLLLLGILVWFKKPKIVYRSIKWLLLVILVVNIAGVSISVLSLGLLSSGADRLESLQQQQQQQQQQAKDSGSTPQQITQPSNQTEQTGEQFSTSNSEKRSGYSPSLCTTTVIPYTTEFKDDPSLYVGETREDFMNNRAEDGKVVTCTPDSNGKTLPGYTTPSWNKVIYRGTKPRPGSNPPDNRVPYSTAVSNCNSIASQGGGYSEPAFQACMRGYGY